MSKRKPAKSSKRARSPAIATRAHGKKQALVKSARDDLLRSVAAGPIESPLELHDDPKEEAPKVEKQEAPNAANPVQVGRSQMRGFDFASATGNMVAYQAKLLEMTQANARFALDFSQKLATIRSPFQFVDVIVEFTKRRADMLEKHSTEMAALSRRWLHAGVSTPERLLPVRDSDGSKRVATLERDPYNARKWEHWTVDTFDPDAVAALGKLSQAF
jgi:hypothetical protein